MFIEPKFLFHFSYFVTKLGIVFFIQHFHFNFYLLINFDNKIFVKKLHCSDF